jgi:hypothetical protein
VVPDKNEAVFFARNPALKRMVGTCSRERRWRCRRRSRSRAGPTIRVHCRTTRIKLFNLCSSATNQITSVLSKLRPNERQHRSRLISISRDTNAKTRSTPKAKPGRSRGKRIQAPINFLAYLSRFSPKLKKGIILVRKCWASSFS